MSDRRAARPGDDEYNERREGQRRVMDLGPRMRFYTGNGPAERAHALIGGIRFPMPDRRGRRRRERRTNPETAAAIHATCIREVGADRRSGSDRRASAESPRTGGATSAVEGEVRVPPESWRWFGHAGHLIVAQWCRFHLCTHIGDFLVSTVGEYWPPRSSREIHASVYDPEWLANNKHRKGDDFDHAYMERFGFETIGCDRTYETMVFRAGAPCSAKDCGCGLPEISGLELDFAPYNDAASATRGHMEMCAKTARGEILERTDDA